MCVCASILCGSVALLPLHASSVHIDPHKKVIAFSSLPNLWEFACGIWWLLLLLHYRPAHAAKSSYDDCTSSPSARKRCVAEEGGVERFFLLLFGNRKDVTPLEKKSPENENEKVQMHEGSEGGKGQTYAWRFPGKVSFPLSISRNARKGFPSPIFFFCSSVFRSAFFFFFLPSPSLLSLTGPA